MPISLMFTKICFRRITKPANWSANDALAWLSASSEECIRPINSSTPYAFSRRGLTRENFQSMIQDLDLPTNPSLYNHAPARLDLSMAPEGQDTVIAIVPVGHVSDNEEQKWAAVRDQARRHVFRRLRTLGITDLKDHIKFEVNYTPLSWRNGVRSFSG